ncbi:hypothetical protein ON010_g16764 [Phytophthora cinnamomi]|nr:hypothetical protein ON010_g16764 [Phytophthora cinnamomi]
MQAQFFHHEGFFGALGTFLQRFNSVAESPAVSETEAEQGNSSEAELEQNSGSKGGEDAQKSIRARRQ